MSPAVRWPLSAVIINLALLIAGGYSLAKLSFRLYPAIESAEITVVTRLPGASSEVTDRLVSQVLEKELIRSVVGASVEATSSSSVSEVRLEFRSAEAAQQALPSVIQSVSAASVELPKAALHPVVSLGDPDGKAIVWLALHSERRKPSELFELASNLISSELKQIPGVSATQVVGPEPALRVSLHLDKMNALAVDVGSVLKVLEIEGPATPSGRFITASRTMPLELKGSFYDSARLVDLSVITSDGRSIRLGEIATVTQGQDNTPFEIRYNGRTAVAVGVLKSPDGNAIYIGQELQEALARINSELPGDVRLDIGFDSTKFVAESAWKILLALGEAVALVCIVVLIGVGSLRASVLPVATIPVSLLGTAVLVSLVGYTVNEVTLLAAVLSIGVIVDDAIILIDRAHARFHRAGSWNGSLDRASRETALPMLAMTLAIAAAFLPSLFQPGPIGRVVSEFGLVIVSSTALSAFVALTLVPALGVRLLRPIPKDRTRAFDAVSRQYSRLIYRILWQPRVFRRLTCAAVLVAASVSVVALFLRIPARLSPSEDPGFVFLWAEASPGVRATAEALRMNDVFDEVSKIDSVEGNFSYVGFPKENASMGFITLSNWSDRGRSASEVANLIHRAGHAAPGVRVFASVPDLLWGNAQSSEVEVQLQAFSGDYDQVLQVASAIVDELRISPLFASVRIRTNASEDSLEVAARQASVEQFGVSSAQIGATLSVLFSGVELGRFDVGGKQLPVIVQAASVDSTLTPNLDQALVQSARGLIPLSSVVEVQAAFSPTEISRAGGRRAIRISGELAVGASARDAVGLIRSVAAQHLHGEAGIVFGGRTERFMQFQSSVQFGLFFCAFSLVAVIAMFFQSLRFAAIACTCLPVTVFGALLGLEITGGTLNLYSAMALLAVCGLSTKHSVFFLQSLGGRAPTGRNVLCAARERFRPIIMTTIAMLVGTLPLMFADGAGAGGRASVGAVVFFGLGLSSLYVMLLLPALYREYGSHRISQR
ncbi:MAG: efflux RND transporter permease subunit [Lysobacterales bacterium]